MALRLELRVGHGSRSVSAACGGWGHWSIATVVDHDTLPPMVLRFADQCAGDRVFRRAAPAQALRPLHSCVYIAPEAIKTF